MAAKSFLQSAEARIFSWIHLPPPRSRLRRFTFWMGLLAVLCTVLALLPGSAGTRFHAARTLVLVFFIPCALIVGFGWFFDLLRNRLLWRLSNRLVVTYLLVGLAPVMLFLILAGLAGYVFAGQFAIYAVSSELENRLNQMGAENRSLARHLVEVDRVHGSRSGGTVARDAATMPEEKADAAAQKKFGASVAVTRDNEELDLPGITSSKMAPPAWAKDHFLGFALDQGKLYLRALDAEQQGSHRVAVISSLPLDGPLLTEITRGLGQTTLLPLSGHSPEVKARRITPEGTPVEVRVHAEPAGASVTGGKATPQSAFYDIPVSFAGETPCTAWDNGERVSFAMLVGSRPVTLYQHLVSYSPEISGVIRVVLITVAVLFGILELIAFIMAVRLNQTITSSVASLYNATLQINRGNLVHRIEVTRNDQLAELSKSFNTMTASLARLLVEQKEKERLQNELSIAQEVQANLFPGSDVALASLELHGVCKPARSVSGDYYDFLVFGENRLGIALGDISGKGISAALLMATLHSAVRAYRIAGEEIISAGSNGRNGGLMLPQHIDALWAQHPQLAQELVQLFDSPAHVLLLLNKHLYRSTQMEKYATLFLAHYDGRDGSLTYSNGGQLPPLLLSRSGAIKRLDCGGPVVGLLPHVEYEQGRVHLRSGDIFVAYSDGVTEPENDFGEFGEERLMKIVEQNRNQPLAEISRQVMQALTAWIGADEQPDDITLVLARQV